MLATGHAPSGFAALLYSYVNLIVLKEKAGIERALIGSELALSGARGARKRSRAAGSTRPRPRRPTRRRPCRSA